MPAFPGGGSGGGGGGGSGSGVVALGGRYIGSVRIDDNVNTFLDHGGIPRDPTRGTQRQGVAGRYGRQSRIREDMKPLTFEVRGEWRDNPLASTPVTYADFKGALMSQRMVQMDLGNGKVYRGVDVEHVAEVRIGGIPGTPGAETWKWSALLASYEPFAVEKQPGLVVVGTGAGTYAVNYNGTAFAEPTWIIMGASAGTYTVANLSSGVNEICTFNLVSGGTVIVDASGAIPGTTPSNDMYGLLPFASLGYGVCVSGGDIDYSGIPPTLVPNPTPTVPASAFSNTISFQGPGGTLTVLAPKRYYE